MNFTGGMSNSGELHQELSKRENNQMGAIALQGIQAERDNLLMLYNQAQEEWRADIHRMEEERRKVEVESAKAIALLKSQVKTLEERLQAAVSPAPAVEPSIPAVAIETPTASPGPSKRPTLWQCLRGGR